MKNVSVDLNYMFRFKKEFPNEFFRKIFKVDLNFVQKNCKNICRKSHTFNLDSSNIKFIGKILI